MEKLKGLIGEDVFKQHVEPKLGADKKYFFSEGEFIPKGRFDEVNNQVNDYKQQLADRDNQLKKLSESAKGNEELTKQIEALRTENQTKITEYEEKLKKQAYDFAYSNALNAAGAKDIKVLSALIDTEKIVYKDGGFTGLNEQIEALKKTHDYVFNQGSPVPSKIGGQPKGNLPTKKGPGIEPAQQRSWNKHKRFI